MTDRPAEQPITLTIVSAGKQEVPAERRLARLCKSILRNFGFRIIAMKTALPPLDQADAPPPKEDTTR